MSTTWRVTLCQTLPFLSLADVFYGRPLKILVYKMSARYVDISISIKYKQSFQQSTIERMEEIKVSKWKRQFTAAVLCFLSLTYFLVAIREPILHRKTENPNRPIRINRTELSLTHNDDLIWQCHQNKIYLHSTQLIHSRNWIAQFSLYLCCSLPLQVHNIQNISCHESYVRPNVVMWKQE